MRAVVLGVLLLVVPGLVAVAALRPDPEVRAWPESPRTEPSKMAAEPYWDGPATESLAKLRELTVSEEKLAGPALARCEVSAGRHSGRERNKAFHACALRPLARVESSSIVNGHILMSLADTARDTCRERVMSLGGLTSTMGQTARSTLRGVLGVEWAEVLAASKTVRAFARDASRFARERGWKSSCRALPERDRPAADEAVA